MKKLDFNTIYNVPEKISGLGYIAHFLGLCMFMSLFIMALPDFLADSNWLYKLVESIISSGIWVTLGMAFIFIACPIFFFVRFIMELFRTIIEKRKFYTMPNIKYLKLNNDSIFFKNTCINHDFTIKKSDIIDVLLTGRINTVTGISQFNTPRSTTYIENVTMLIRTENQTFTIYPVIRLNQVKLEWFDYVKGKSDIDSLKLLIMFFEEYFDNFSVKIDSDNSTQSIISANELEQSNKFYGNGNYDIPEFLQKK